MLETVLFVILALVALFGSLTQIYPGLILVVIGSAIWASETGGQAWWWFAGVTLVFVVALVAKYLLPGKYMKREGISNRTLLVGALFAVVGFFVIPVVGLFIGFVLGVYVAEFARDRAQAWAKTKVALKGVGSSILLEVTATALSLVLLGWGMWVL